MTAPGPVDPTGCECTPTTLCERHEAELLRQMDEAREPPDPEDLDDHWCPFYWQPSYFDDV